MRQFFIIALVCGLFSSLIAQTSPPNFWTPVAQEALALPANAGHTIQAAHLSGFQLNYEAIETTLKQAPMEFTRAAKEQPLVLGIPMADGSVRNFRVVESPVMAPELVAQYPSIRTYSGVATDNPGVIVRLGVGYKGFHAFIFGDPRGAQSVRRYAESQNDLYVAYKAADLPSDPLLESQLRCGTDDFGAILQEDMSHSDHTSTSERNTEPVQLKVYRAAIAAQGEYSIFNGGTKPLVMAAIVEAMNYINGLLERDFAVRFQLIPNNDEIIFLDPATDPYMGENDVPAWRAQNAGAVNPIIGINNYDVGHVFCQTGAGGVIGQASLGSVCDILNKAGGASSWFTPNDEKFYLTTAHEMCHQLSGTHTFSSCPPNADATSDGTAFEPGSGTTIMSYAGACGTNNNIQNMEEAYYHIASILQVQNFKTQGGGAQCGQLMDTDNSTPTASTEMQPLGLYLPISTPFVLSGTGSDPEGDALTYCWEQYDLGPMSPLGSPTGSAPSFRSYFPVPVGERILPRIQALVNNTPSDAEVLPTYNRQLTFRMTVRDNHPEGGGLDWLEVKMNATTTAGPFVVSYPNELVTWNVGEYRIVTWEVANTNGPLVNCQSVNIHLSTDGGLTYPVMLASGVPNAGSYCVQVPNNVTNNARIRVQADDHIFFDISNVNFKIQQPTAAGFTVCGALKDRACLPNGYTTEVNTSSTLGFNTPIQLSIAGLPAGATATFSPNPVQPGSNSLLTIEFAADQPEATFTATISATAGTTRTYDLIITTVRNDFSGFELLSPADGAAGINISPVLSWNGVADANLYEVELATSPSFTPETLILGEYSLAADSLDLPGFLVEGTAYYWRVRPKNECGTIEWSEPFVFMTQVQTCQTFTSTDVPKNISANGTPVIESVITIPSGGAVSDVNVKKVQGNHNFFGDLEVRLLRPTGGNVLLFKNRCSSYAGNFNIAFDDVANGAFPCPPPQNGLVYKPTENLSVFNGQVAEGDWVLWVKDNVSSSGGQLTGFQLELCSNVSLSGPFIVNNNVLQVISATNAEITTALLQTQDANNTADQLTYTLITVPGSGILQKNWGGAMKAGDQFTQTELDNGAIRYFDYGISAGDDFRFAVTDGEGGIATGVFVIQATGVGTNDLHKKLAFDLAPNPADESVRISFSEALSSDTQISLYNTAGQLLRSRTLGSGEMTLQLQIADLPQGIYTVLVSNNLATGARKLVVK